LPTNGIKDYTGINKRSKLTIIIIVSF